MRGRISKTENTKNYIIDAMGGAEAGVEVTVVGIEGEVPAGPGTERGIINRKHKVQE